MTVAQSERRGWPRLKVNWGIRLFRTDDPVAVSATLENISSGGVCFLSSTPFEDGERMNAQILLPVETQPWGNGPVMLDCDLRVLRSESRSALEYHVSCEIRSYRVRAARPETPSDTNGHAAR